LFLQLIADGESYRIVIPPAAMEAIARQREALTVKGRRIRGKQAATDRKARGELPGFMKGKQPRKAAQPRPRGKPLIEVLGEDETTE
jgi:hypothetical protein